MGPLGVRCCLEQACLEQDWSCPRVSWLAKQILYMLPADVSALVQACWLVSSQPMTLWQT